MLGSIERYGRVPFADFYAKRVRRILPAWLFVLVVSLLLAVVFAVVKKPEGAVACGGGGGRPRPHAEPHAHVVCAGGYASGAAGGCW